MAPTARAFRTYAAGLHAAWTGRADAAYLLAEIAADRQAPAIARASALTELSPRVSPSNVDLARKGLTDPDPMVRIGALDMLEGMPIAQRWPLASPLLADAVQGVRIRAASLLASVPTAQLNANDRQRFGRAADEFIAAQKLNADRPEARSMLAIVLRATRSDGGSRDRVQGRAAARAHNTCRQQSTSPISIAAFSGKHDGEDVLRGAIAVSSAKMPGFITRSALTLVRLKRLDEALGELRRAAELAPEQAQIRLCLRRRVAFCRTWQRGDDRSQRELGAPSGRSRYPAGPHQLQPGRGRSGDRPGIRGAARTDCANRPGHCWPNRGSSAAGEDTRCAVDSPNLGCVVPLRHLPMHGQALDQLQTQFPREVDLSATHIGFRTVLDGAKQSRATKAE